MVSLQSRTEVLGKAVHQMRNDTSRDDAGPARKRTQVQVQKDYEGVQMKSSIEQFKEWFYGYTGCDPKDSRYANMVEMYWMAWQASRAAIEITLPDCDDYQSTWQYQDAAELKIKGLGLSVK